MSSISSADLKSDAFTHHTIFPIILLVVLFGKMFLKINCAKNKCICATCFMPIWFKKNILIRKTALIQSYICLILCMPFKRPECFFYVGLNVPA